MPLFSQPIYLDLKIKCNSYMKIYMAENLDQLIRLTKLDTEYCSIFQEFTSLTLIAPIECYNSQFGANQVNECDRRDPRKLMNPDIVQACDQLNGNKYQIYSKYTGTYYKNIFCSICDLPKHNTEMCHLQTVPQPKLILFEMLIQIQNMDTISIENNNKSSDVTAWCASNGECLQLMCSSGKALNKRECKSIFPDIICLEYKVKALLILLQKTSQNNLTIDRVLDLAETQIVNDVSNISEDYSYQMGVFMDVEKKVTEVLWVNIYIKASRLLTRDSFENIAVDNFFGGRFNKSFHPFFYYNILLDSTNEFMQSNNSDLTIRAKESYKSVSSFYRVNRQYYLILSPILTCVFVTFQRNDYTVQRTGLTEADGLLVKINMAGRKLSISNMSDINNIQITGDGMLHICAYTFEKYFNISKRSDITLRQFYQSFQVLRYACTGASEICLLITVVTYLGFPELRTVPGINNMFLSLSLFLAQLALVITPNIPGPSDLCTCFGILTHFLWLWHFTWSFLCGLHMFQVFTATMPTLSKTENICVYVLKLMSLSISSPILIIAVVILTSHTTSPTIGYGRHLCLLDSTFMLGILREKIKPTNIGVSMVAPVCLVCLCNLTFLSTTAVRIHGVNTLSTFDALKKSNFKRLSLDAMISSVSCMYWIVTLVAVVLDNDVLSIFSILLNGLQGVLIFISYASNETVFKLCFKANKLPRSSSTKETY
nr:adhesion G protein-coupled receptor E3-like [Biomphalaria glabrata]